MANETFQQKNEMANEMSLQKNELANKRFKPKGFGALWPKLNVIKGV